MKKLFSILCFAFALFIQAQNEQFAQNYFDRGEFEKALLSYDDLLKSQPSNFNYFQRTVECYQQLQQFEKAEKMALLKYKNDTSNIFYKNEIIQFKAILCIFEYFH